MDPRRRKRIVLASILLHILFLALWEASEILNLFSDELLSKNVLPEPLVLEFNQPKIEPSLPREVIETPEDAKVVEKQEKANFLSDKNALARNPETNPNLNIGESFSRGDFNSHELPKQEGPRGKTLDTPKHENKTPEEKAEEPEDKPGESDKYANLIQPPLREPQLPFGIQEQLPSVTHDNQATRAEDMGGLSFNTYDWNFAPYMLMLKRRIQRNIFPPPAFSKLGMINGDTLLRFKIYPNGIMKDLEILNYKGHESLMVTSRNAVQTSAPFPQLPVDFPEKYLEVTGKFIYFIRK